MPVNTWYRIRLKDRKALRHLYTILGLQRYAKSHYSAQALLSGLMANLDEEVLFDAENVDNSDKLALAQFAQVIPQPQREALSIYQIPEMHVTVHDTIGTALRRRSGATCFSRPMGVPSTLREPLD